MTGDGGSAFAQVAADPPFLHPAKCPFPRALA